MINLYVCQILIYNNNRCNKEDFSNMVYGHIRVSTDKQTVKNQKIAIKEYCKYHRLHHIQWVRETISGTKMPNKRKLGDLLKNQQERFRLLRRNMNCCY